jgi:type I restriction enzyme, S subunit
MKSNSSAWPRFRLGEVLRIKHGFGFKGKFFSPDPGDLVLTPGNFEETGGLKFRPDKDRSYIGSFPDEFRLHPGELLIVMTDLTQEARILGAPAFVPEDIRCLHNQRLGKVVDIDAARLDLRFLYYLFNYREFRETLKSTATGSTVRHTSPGRIESYLAALPPLAVQRRIASVLGAYDDLIEVNRHRIGLLEEMARRLFEEWFVRFRFPGHEGHPMVRTPKEGSLPAGWGFVRLDKVACVNRDTIRPPSAPPQIGYVDISSVTCGEVQKIDRMSFADAPGRARRRVRDGSIIWSTVRPNRRSYAFIYNPDDDLVVSTGFAVLDANNISATYLYHYVTTDDFVGYLVGNATGSAYPAVTGATFERAKVLLPTEEVDKLFNSIAEPALRLINTLRAQNNCLSLSRDLLLPRLISGELPMSAVEHELEAVA